MDLSFISKKLKGISAESEPFIILKPDHKNIYDICEIVIKLGIPSINHAEVTKLFKNRWEMEQKIKNYLDIAHETGKFHQIMIPESWYVNSSKIRINDELIKFIKKTGTIFQDRLPMVAKYPFYHEGVHFVRKISDVQSLYSVIRNFKYSGIIIQQFIETTGNILKIYSIGDTTFYFQSKCDISQYQENEILENKNTMKLMNKMRKNPRIIQDFIEFIKNFLNIELFGCDFLEVGGKYYFIDINDFPGYQGVHDADQYISEYIIKKSMNKIRKNEPF